MAYQGNQSVTWGARSTSGWPASLRDSSMCAWVRRTGNGGGGWGGLLNAGNTSNYLGLWQNNTALYHEFNSSSTNVFNMTQDVWYFVACTSDAAGEDQNVYRRIQSDTSLTNTNIGGVVSNSAWNTVHVCDSPWTEYGDFDICAVKLFDAELTADELMAESLQYLPIHQNCIAFWDLADAAFRDNTPDWFGAVATLNWNGTPTTVDDGPNIIWGMRAPSLGVPAAAVGPTITDVNFHGVLRGNLRGVARGVG